MTIKTRKTRVLVAAVMIAFGWALMSDAMAAPPQVITLVVDVGSGTSLNMGMGPGGMGGSIMTGGGPVLMDSQQFGTMMHSTMTSTMTGMMGGQTLQQRMMSFDIPGMGTVFAMMAGGNPWTGGKGIIMGGTDGLQGVSGTFTVGAQVGATQYEFTCTFVVP